MVRWSTLNPYGTARAGAPLHVEAARLLAKAGVKNAIIGGELYVRRPDGKRARVHDVCRIARAPASEAEVASLYFAVFAIYDLDGRDLSGDAAGALARIRSLFADGTHVHPVETVAGDEKEVHGPLQAVGARGGRGRPRRRQRHVGSFKIKPRHTLDLAVIGFSESIEEPCRHAALAAARGRAS